MRCSLARLAFKLRPMIKDPFARLGLDREVLTVSRVQEVVSRAAGPSATASVRDDGTWVTVTVRSSVTGGWFSGPFEVSASATGLLESAAGLP